MNREWFWCLHCHRAFETERPSNWFVGGFVERYGILNLRCTGELDWHCPYPDCDGQAEDFIPWTEMLRHEPLFPSHPRPGEVYEPRFGGLLGTMLLIEV